MPRRDWISAFVCATVLTLSACDSEPEGATVGEPLPDTFPVAGAASGLPEGMPLPPAPEDTLPE